MAIEATSPFKIAPSLFGASGTSSAQGVSSQFKPTIIPTGEQRFACISAGLIPSEVNYARAFGQKSCSEVGTQFQCHA